MAWRTTEQSDDDLAEIEIYGTMQFGRRQAEEYIDDLLAAFEVLSASPRIVPQRAGLPGHPRLYVFRSHYVVFLIDDGDVVIIRVLHIRSDIARHL